MYHTSSSPNILVASYAINVPHGIITVPDIYKYLLEQVRHLVLIFGEHIAHGIYCPLVFPHYVCKFLFNRVHQI